MEFYQFVQIIHNILRPDLNKEEIINEIILNIINDNSDNPVEGLNSFSTFSRYYNGEIGIKRIAKKIIDNTDQTKFMNYLNKYIKTDDQGEQLVIEFEKKGIPLNKFNLNEEISKLFLEILFNAVKEKNIKPNNKKMDTSEYQKDIYSLDKIANTELEDINKTIAPNISYRLELKDSLLTTKIETKIPGLTEDFTPELVKENNHYRYRLKAKTPEAYKKHDFRIDFKFPKEKAKDLNFRSMLNEANLNNKFIKIGEPISIIEKIDGKINPFSNFNTEKLEKSELFIGPNPEPLERKIKLYIYNDFISFKLSDIRVHLLVEDENVSKFYNKRFEDDWYNIELFISCNKKEKLITTNYNLEFKEDYYSDIEKFIEIFKFFVLLRDKSSITKLSIYIDDEKKWIDLINSEEYGIEDLNAKDKEYILKQLSIMEKLIKIQYLNNIKFKFDYKCFYSEINLIDKLCDVVLGNEVEITKPIIWSLKAEKNKAKEYKIGDNYYLKESIPSISLFDKNINIKDMVIEIKGKIKEITQLDDKSIINVISDDIKFKKNNK